MKDCHTTPALLADDLLIYAKGQDMLPNFSQALTRTHTYLQDLGATLSTSKSYNFATTASARDWLNDTTWYQCGHIRVVTDFRYVGAHFCLGKRRCARTLDCRIDRACSRLRALAHLPRTLDQKYHIILERIFPAAFYAVEVNHLTRLQHRQLTAANAHTIQPHNHI